VSQAIHHSRKGRGNLEDIRIAAVNDRHWERMGGEEEHGVAMFLFKFLESCFDILGDSLIWRERKIWGEGRWVYFLVLFGGTHPGFIKVGTSSTSTKPECVPPTNTRK
jgi:hypothetical protein